MVCSDSAPIIGKSMHWLNQIHSCCLVTFTLLEIQNLPLNWSIERILASSTYWKGFCSFCFCYSWCIPSI